MNFDHGRIIKRRRDSTPHRLGDERRTPIRQERRRWMPRNQRVSPDPAPIPLHLGSNTLLLSYTFFDHVYNIVVRESFICGLALGYTQRAF